MLTHYERPVGRSYGVYTGHSSGGGDFKSLINNDEREFKSLTFWAY